MGLPHNTTVEHLPEGKPVLRSFAHGLNPYKLVWIFAIGSFIGVLVETFWCFIMTGHIESRAGLIYGPFNPVYGFGAVAMTLALYWLRDRRWYFIFLGGFVLGAAFEFSCSWVQENVFGTISWDYDATPLNIAGRTNAMYAFFWGLLGLVWIKVLFPWMARFIEKIPNRVGLIVTWVMIVFFAFDMTISALASMRMTARHENIPAQTAVDTFFDTYYADERMAKVYTHTIYVNENGSKTNMSREELEKQQREQEKAAASTTTGTTLPTQATPPPAAGTAPSAPSASAGLPSTTTRAAGG